MNSERILIVEDEKIIALDLQRRLERFGYSVIDMTSDGEEAIALAKSKEPDIILMDIMLSGPVDGIEAAKAIHRELRIPVIFLTAYADEKTLERAKEAEPFGYILKPFKERELYTTVDIALYKNSIDKKLRQQERLFSAILHSINDGIIAVDTDYLIRFMNPIAEDISGYREQEAQGKNLSQVLSIVDLRSQKSVFGGAPLNIGDKPLFFGESMIKNRKGETLIVDGSITRLHEKQNESEGFLLTLRDITEIKRMSATIDYQASHDSLTGLSNREEFSFKLNEILKSLKTEGTNHILLALDIDRFKVVNDTAGALAGDELLRQISAFIQSLTQRHDITARMGGDEFSIILMNCSVEDSVNVAKRLQDAVANHKFMWQNNLFSITLSIGIVPLDRESSDIHGILAAADDACNLSKEEGGNKINVFQSGAKKFQQRRGQMEWIGKINRCIEQDKFLLYFQPIEPLIPEKGYSPKIEILLRLVNGDGSVSGPGEFIPAAERYNLMPAVDRWVLHKTLKEFRDLKDEGNPLADMIFSINLSGTSLLDDSLADYIIFEVTKQDLSPEKFCFEITETSAIQNLSYASRFIKKLKDKGFTFSLDDFGSGFSSFSYLKNLPVDYLKIDGTFVQSIDESLVSYTMVDSINSMGHVMGLKTIAEFVRSKSVKKKLVEIGVDFAQGYEIAEPKPLRS